MLYIRSFDELMELDWPFAGLCLEVRKHITQVHHFELLFHEFVGLYVEMNAQKHEEVK